jgi:hypothetical protein
MTVPAATYLPEITLDPTAYAITTATPIPVVLAGDLPMPTHGGVPAVSPFGITQLPVRVVATEPLLPRVERNGVLVDLDYADALAGSDSGAETSEVWLSADAPASIVRALGAQGLTIADEQTVDARARAYGEQASVVGQRFQVLGGAIGLALAAVALLVVASVERDPRARELVALRHQGVAARATRAVARRGYAWLAGTAIVVGMVAAVLDRFVSGSAASQFTDGWRVLPRPPLIPLSGFVTTLVVSVASLALAGGLAAYQLIRAVRSRGQEASG